MSLRDDVKHQLESSWEPEVPNEGVILNQAKKQLLKGRSTGSVSLDIRAMKEMSHAQLRGTSDSDIQRHISVDLLKQIELLKSGEQIDLDALDELLMKIVQGWENIPNDLFGKEDYQDMWYVARRVIVKAIEMPNLTCFTSHNIYFTYAGYQGVTDTPSFYASESSDEFVNAFQIYLKNVMNDIDSNRWAVPCIRGCVEAYGSILTGNPEIAEQLRTIGIDVPPQKRLGAF